MTSSPNAHGGLRRSAAPAVGALLFVGCFTVAAAQGHAHGGTPPAETQKTVAADELGIEVVGVRPSAAGKLIDVRVRVVDPIKALTLLGRAPKRTVLLIDAKSGQALAVPDTKVGTLRQTTFEPEPGKIYALLFYNPGVVRPGDEVQLVVDDKRLVGLHLASLPPGRPLGAVPVEGTAPVAVKSGT